MKQLTITGQPMHTYVGHMLPQDVHKYVIGGGDLSDVGRVIWVSANIITTHTFGYSNDEGIIAVENVMNWKGANGDQQVFFTVRNASLGSVEIEIYELFVAWTDIIN